MGTLERVPFPQGWRYAGDLSPGIMAGVGGSCEEHEAGRDQGLIGD